MDLDGNGCGQRGVRRRIRAHGGRQCGGAGGGRAGGSAELAVFLIDKGGLEKYCIGFPLQNPCMIYAIFLQYNQKQESFNKLSCFFRYSYRTSFMYNSG